MKAIKISICLLFLPISSLASIDIASGTASYTETDYVFKSSQSFSFSKYYSHPYRTWRFDFDNQIKYSNVNNIETISVFLPTFENVFFRKINNVWTSTNNSLLKIEIDGSNNLILVHPNGDKEFYTNSNNLFNSETVFLLSKTLKSNGQYLNFIHNSNNLTTIIDSNDNNFNINYTFCNNKKLVSSLIGVGGKTITYNYNNSCYLESVIYPDGSVIKYTYSSTYLNKVYDENNNIYKTISYSSSNNAYQPGYKAISESFGTNANINKITSNYSTSNKVKVTDALNNSLNINTIKNNNIFKIVGYESICTFCNGIQGSEISYDALGQIDTVKDFNGNISKYSWNNKKQIVSVTEAFGTTLERMNTFTYNQNGFLSHKTEPVSGGIKSTTYTYNTNNLITDIKETAPSNNSTSESILKTFHFIYDEDKIVEARGALYNSQNQDKISFTYNNRGQVSSFSNGLNQTTFFNNYDDYGNVTQITLPNSNVVFMNYDLRGQLINSTFKSSLLSTDGETTSYIYSLNGLVTKIIKPSGASYVMEYDNASRLISIEDWSEPTTTSSNGVYMGKISYSLDNMSNVKKIELFDKNNTQIRLATKDYDNKNRLYKDIGALNQKETYTYDSNSNLISLTDADNYSNIANYDNLNRIFQITYPDQSIINISYNSDDTTSSVIDPKGLTTVYLYDGFSNLIQQNSPDTGITSYTYDLNDNLISKIDAVGNTTNYTYDVLGRVIRLDYPNSTDFSSFSYDTCMIGKLCIEETKYAKTTYTYTTKGRLSSKKIESMINNSSNISSFDATIVYNYNNYGQLISITYPNQNKVLYNYFNDKISNVSYYIHSTNETKILVSDITYSPFSSLAESMIWNTLQGDFNHSKTLNKDGLIISIENTQPSGLHLNFSYDNRLNMIGINNPKENNDISNSFDNLSRLISSSNTSLSNNLNYSYNTSSDRTSHIKNNNLSNYSYNSNNHKLLNISGYENHNYSYDLNGNTISDNNLNYFYNKSNRLNRTTNPNSNITTDYLYNSFGERYFKKTELSNNIKTQWFIYDEYKVLYEKNENNNVFNSEINYIYLNDTPIAMIKNDDIFYIQTDHLGTPRVILDKNNNLSWKWDYLEPFGNNQPIENGLEFNIRFSGQYWDSEKSSSYNINRDYNSIIGRYLQSDPLGLEAGINTYGYANANPLFYIDENGNIPSLPQGIVDFGAGLGDNVTFGISKAIRNLYNIGNVDNCSSSYLIGQYSGIALSFITAYGYGTKANAKLISNNNWQNYSHTLIPNRTLKKIEKSDIPILSTLASKLRKSGNRLNGDHVTPEAHTRMDKVAKIGIPKQHLLENPPYQGLRHYINRVPYMIGISSYSGGSLLNNMNECNCK